MLKSVIIPSEEIQARLVRTFELYKRGEATLKQVRKIGRMYSRVCKMESNAYTSPGFYA